ncbi:hypothetical protein ACEI36_14880 [Pseudomonas kielensis]|uniref:hypothetical protein n=1 Tax=Pseudomonas kielensis TaxID=2762577 RepID=UPI0038B0A2D7
MTPTSLSKKIGLLRATHQKSLNNIYIWTSFARGALDVAKDDAAFLSQTRLKVPSKVRGKEVVRTVPQLKKIAEVAVAWEIYYSVFVYAVAQVEAFLGDALFEILSFDNRRLQTRVKGIDHTNKIDVTDIIKASSREEIIAGIIEKELASLFYASPLLQMEYFQAVAGISIPEELVLQWVEIKATRDIIVHSSGISNSVYVKKSSSYARAVDGEILPMDDKYFALAVSSMKSLIGKSSSLIQQKLKVKAV